MSISVGKKKVAGTASASGIRASDRGRSTQEEWHSNLPATVSRPELLDRNGVSDLQFRQFLYDLSALGAHIETARAYLASQIGLSSPQYNCAMIVAYFQGREGVSVSEVARHLHVTTAFVTCEAGKLERAGLIKKHPNPKDGRGILLRLTKLGETRLVEVGQKRLLINDGLFRSISAHDFRHLAKTAASLIGDFAATVQALKLMEVEHARQTGKRASLGERKP
jgi:DNA-binding MarR family transcriptional regulator